MVAIKTQSWLLHKFLPCVLNSLPRILPSSYSAGAIRCEIWESENLSHPFFFFQFTSQFYMFGVVAFHSENASSQVYWRHSNYGKEKVWLLSTLHSPPDVAAINSDITKRSTIFTTRLSFGTRHLISLCSCKSLSKGGGRKKKKLSRQNRRRRAFTRVE